MYIPGRLRTASRPSSTDKCLAEYSNELTGLLITYDATKTLRVPNVLPPQAREESGYAVSENAY